MNRKVALVMSLFLVGLFLTLGCGARPQVVATVNGVELTEEDLDRELRHTRAFYLSQGVDLTALNPDNPSDAALLAQIDEESMRRIIDQELIRQIAEGLFPPPQEGQARSVVTITDEEVEARAQQYEEQAESREVLLRDNGFISYEEFLDFVRGELRVEKLYQLYGQAEQVHVRHILVSTEEEARQVLARLEAGEDFAALALEISLDVTSGQNGGDLGWFGRGMAVAPFEEASYSLEVDEISEPVETQFGFHIIQMLEKATQPDPNAFQQWFDQMRGQAEIERYPQENP